MKALLRRLDAYQRTHAWAGFPYAVIRKFVDDQASNFGAVIAYYTFFSIFPLVLLAFTVLKIVLRDNPELRLKVLSSALASFPGIGEQILKTASTGTVRGQGLGIVLGVAGLLWAGTRAMKAWQDAMNGVWNLPRRDRPKFVETKLRSLLMLLTLGGGVIVSAAMSALGAREGFVGAGLRTLALAGTVTVNVCIFLVAFKVLTDVQARWRILLPGAITAGLGWSALQALGTALVERQVSTAETTYGPVFAVVVGLLWWIYLQSQIALLAGEVNVVRAKRLWPRSLIPKEDLTPADERALRHFVESEERVPGGPSVRSRP